MSSEKQPSVACALFWGHRCNSSTRCNLQVVSVRLGEHSCGKCARRPMHRSEYLCRRLGRPKIKDYTRYFLGGIPASPPQAAGTCGSKRASASGCATKQVAVQNTSSAICSSYVRTAEDERTEAVFPKVFALQLMHSHVDGVAVVHPSQGHVEHTFTWVVDFYPC
jgi:hypothetical protein